MSIIIGEGMMSNHYCSYPRMPPNFIQCSKCGGPISACRATCKKDMPIYKPVSAEINLNEMVAKLFEERFKVIEIRLDKLEI